MSRLNTLRSSLIVPRTNLNVPMSGVSVTRSRIGVPRSRIGVPRSRIGVPRSKIGVPRLMEYYADYETRGSVNAKTKMTQNAAGGRHSIQYLSRGSQLGQGKHPGFRQLVVRGKE